MSDQIRANFTRYLQQQMGLVDFKITGWERLTDGWETDVYAYELSLPDRTEHSILRIFAGDSLAKARHEYFGMSALDYLGYRVPKVNHLCEDRGVLGGVFILMERIFGQPVGRVIAEHPNETPTLFARFIGLLAELHQLPPVPLHELVSDVMPVTTPADFWVNKIAQARQILTAHFEWTTPLLDWLDEHTPYFPAGARVATLHNDYHPYNVLVNDERDLLVIDWPNIEIGDYRYDLAWTILLMTTYGQAPNMREMILAEYSRQAGQPVIDIEIYESVAAGRRLIDMMRTMGGGGESVGMLAETVTTMRNQAAHFRAVYGVLQSRSGLRLPAVEAMLNQLESGQ